jgi:hypothetical protein
VLASPAIATSVAVARRYADQAQAALEPLRLADGSALRARRLDVLGAIGHHLLDQLDLPLT